MSFCNKNHWQLAAKLRRAISLNEQKNLPFCNKYKITSLQLNILCTIYFCGPQTISDLAQSNCIARGNNSVLCKKLEKEGFLVRERDIEDERQVLVKLTPFSEKMVLEFIKKNKQHQQNMLDVFTEEELEFFAQKLDLVLDIIKKNMGDIK